MELRSKIAELEKIEELLQYLTKRADELNKEIDEYQVVNGLFYPMVELLKYRGSKICEIRLIEKRECGLCIAEYNPEYKTIEECFCQWIETSVSYIGFLDMYYIPANETDCEYCSFYIDHLSNREKN